MPHTVRHVATAKAARPKKRNNTKKHRAALKRRALAEGLLRREPVRQRRGAEE